jgi:hypothetical protein
VSEHHDPHNKRWTRRPEGSNWGDFGPDDELGRMGTITPQMRLAAIAEVKEGKAFALSLPLDLPGGEPPDAGRFGPKLWPTKLFGQEVYNLPLTAKDICSDDGVTMCLQYSTQWDSLAHWAGCSTSTGETTGAALDGRDEALLNWIEHSGVVALVADNQAVEAFDASMGNLGHNGLLPLHDRCLFKLGIHLGEMFWLGDLARYLGQVRRSAFLFTGPPLRLPGAVGSPATAVALV